MLKALLQREFPGLLETVVPVGGQSSLRDSDLWELFVSVHQLARRFRPGDPAPLVRIGEAYHLRGDLYNASRYYREALELDPPQPLTEAEERRILHYAPLLCVTPAECFALLDVVAIHHPAKPLIAYHLFWEDDYDYPDDFEPSDHEQVWIAYDPSTERVDGVWAFFHTRIMASREAVAEANENGGRAKIRIEWGKHGSLLKGWETLADPESGEPLTEMLKRSYSHVAQGGRMKDHPLKRWWPARFEGDFRDYLDFSRPLETREWLETKRKMCKSRWANAVLQQQLILYNFHPKYDWP